MKIFYTGRWEEEGIVEIDNAQLDDHYADAVSWYEGDNGFHIRKTAYQGQWFEKREDAISDVKRRRRNLLRRLQRRIERIKKMEIA